MERVTKFFTMCSAAFKAGILGLLFLIVLGFWALSGSGGDIDTYQTSYGITSIHESTIVSKRVALSKRAANAGMAEAPPSTGKPVAVLQFNGDTNASERNILANLVDELVFNKDKFDSVIVVLNSGGGAVPHYGQAYAEMERIRAAGLDLTVSIDIAAASGGYWMSVPANKIVAAPMAMVGSIGVVSEMYNVHDLLKQLGVEPLTFTAGKYKRTVTMTNEVTEEGKRHMQGQLDAIHEAFKASVLKWRPNVNQEVAFTADHWTAQESVAKKLGLVDEIATSHQYLFEVNRNKDLVFLSMRRPSRSILSDFIGVSADAVIDRIMVRMEGGFN